MWGAISFIKKLRIFSEFEGKFPQSRRMLETLAKEGKYNYTSPSTITLYSSVVFGGRSQCLIKHSRIIFHTYSCMPALIVVWGWGE